MIRILIVLLLISIAAPVYADEQNRPVKRVMNYIAVMDLDVRGGLDKDMARPLTESIIREIIKSRKYEVIDRANMDKILEEQAFQLTGCVDEKCAVKVGQMLGVGKMVIGAVSKVGETYYLSLSLLNVESGKIENAVEEIAGREKHLMQSSKKAARKLMGIEEQATIEDGVHIIVSQRIFFPKNHVFDEAMGGITGYYVGLDISSIFYVGVDLWTRLKIRRIEGDDGCAD